MAGRIARAAVERGVWVISGGAFGVGAAYEAAGDRRLDRRGAGAGLDRPAPASHRGLFRHPRRGGRVASPFACGQGAAGGRFPGATPGSPSLARASWWSRPASAAGRYLRQAALASQTPVFVVPGPFDSPTPRRLPRPGGRGARLLTAVDGWCDERVPPSG
ncbi:MAG: hypothetical protein R3F43_14165 [bacterium]